MIPRLVSHILEFSRIDTNLIYCIFELENPCGVGPTVQGNPVTIWISLFRRSLANASLLVQETWLFYRHTELCLFSMLLPCTFLIGPCVSIIFKHPTNDIEINDPSSFSDSCVANCHCLEIQAAINNWRCAPPLRFEAGKNPKEDLLSSRAFGGRFLHRYHGVARWPHWVMVGVGFLEEFPSPYHPCMVYLPTFGWFLREMYIGKYTIHGYYEYYNILQATCFLFQVDQGWNSLPNDPKCINNCRGNPHKWI